MATISIGLSGSAVVTGSKNYTLTDAAVTKLIAWARTAYPFKNAQGVDDRTNAQVLVAWTDAFINATRDAVTKVDRDAALAQAASATPAVVIA